MYERSRTGLSTEEIAKLDQSTAATGNDEETSIYTACQHSIVMGKDSPIDHVSRKKRRDRK
jgi:hypothetical protein